jgi:hypothetical protein
MNKILSSLRNTDDYKRYLIPKSSDINCHDWAEITIDYLNNVFVAKKINLTEISDEWIEYGDSTFPSSLLTHFLNR